MTNADINKKTVLIADDDAKNRKLFKVALRDSGCEIVEAEDGEQCVKLTKEKLPDLILMDIQMPVMDGITALKTLIADPATSKIPVIAVTSYAMKGDRERFLAEGFVDYIPKPIDVNKFKEVIGKYI
ncbi:MAG: response regulator [Nitrospirae bacterium]|nr:response regulator [Nitrospirota bacterium]